MNGRRRSDGPTSTTEYLQQLPALVLLDRLLVPVIAVDTDGELTYANPAFARMLGYFDTAALTGRRMSALVKGRAGEPPRDSAVAARGALVDWCHAEGYAVRTVVSDTMLLRSTDPLLLVSVSDLTERLWSGETS